ncbi:LysM peptidoglycan-binding domain-containing protein [Pedococcus bigeumensis]|uniref:LysM peptidoglycan-binding domain-containing protein n=1 Tax=Pedococcus bigeumensis TaxID=433644 RepID=A0A502CMD0_9MICO|nr:LysM peptidoglycan-binding domain-containing protein [Pedococcus bigeumensis]TPG12926.1 LysM peptidoglycan-binding domain-containing protein [Pedococcus bigeumensis]
MPTGAEVAALSATPLRLTRAARLALTLTVVIAAVALAIALFAGGASATVIDHSTTVQSGQTLSEIAVRELPQLSMAEAVVQLQVANDLTGSNVHAGQTLLIPKVG